MRKTVHIVKYKIKELQRFIDTDVREWTASDQVSIKEALEDYKALLERGVEHAELPSIFNEPGNNLKESLAKLPE